MNRKEKQICNRISEHLAEAFSVNDSAGYNYHAREALQLLVSVKESD